MKSCTKCNSEAVYDVYKPTRRQIDTGTWLYVPLVEALSQLLVQPHRSEHLIVLAGEDPPPGEPPLQNRLGQASNDSSDDFDDGAGQGSEVPPWGTTDPAMEVPSRWHSRLR